MANLNFFYFTASSRTTLNNNLWKGHVMKKTLVLLLGSVCMIFFVTTASAMTYVCTKDGKERLITVVYDIQGSNVPCEVTYQKEDESLQGLWRAQNTEGYCEGKAAEFAQKQESWGWQCEMVEDVPAPAAEDNTAQ